MKEGAVSIVHAAVSPEVNGKGGTFIHNCRIKGVNPKATNIKIQERLFKISKKLANIKDFGKPIY